MSSNHKLEPEVYKTRKDENFVEYFRSGKDNKGNRQLIKVDRYDTISLQHFTFTLKNRFVYEL